MCGVLAALLATVLAACGSTSTRGTPARSPIVQSAVAHPDAAQRPVLVYVVRRHWHIDIGFAAADLVPPLDDLSARFEGLRYALFGFGDRHYLLAKHHDAPDMLGALWPGPGMMLVTGLDTPPARAFGAAHVIEITISAAQARAAEAYIASSFAGAAAVSAGAPLPKELAPGPYPGSLYFSAVPQYSAFHTCNTWAAGALRAAGLPVRSSLVLFAGQLWRQSARLGVSSSDVSHTGADCRSGRPPWSSSLAAPPPSSSRAAKGCCC